MEIDVKQIMKDIVSSYECLEEIKIKSFQFIMSDESLKKQFIEFVGDDYWKEFLKKYPLKKSGVKQ